jgi:hypothetical protein
MAGGAAAGAEKTRSPGLCSRCAPRRASATTPLRARAIVAMESAIDVCACGVRQSQLRRQRQRRGRSRVGRRTCRRPKWRASQTRARVRSPSPWAAPSKGLYGTNARGLYIIYPGTVGLFGLGERGDVGTLAQ